MERRTVVIATAALVVLAVVVVGWLALTGGLGGTDASPSPSASPDASPTAEPSAEGTPPASPSEAPTESPEPSEQAGGPISVAWRSVGGLDASANINGIAFVDGRWVAVGNVLEGTPVAAIWTSDDATTWTRAEVETTQTPDEYTIVTDVAEIDGSLVAIGAWGAVPSDQSSWIVWRSTDGGTTWTEMRDGPEAGALQAVVPGGPGLIGVGWSGSIAFDSWIATTADGVTWERLPATFAMSQVHSVAVAGGRWVAVGARSLPSGEPDAAAWYSDDEGETWTVVAVPDGGTSESLNDVVALDDRFVAVGGGLGGAAAWVSLDGATWERIPVDPQAEARALTPSGLIAVGNVVGQDIGPGQAWTSTDGQDWETGEQLGTGSVRFTAVAADGSTAVAGGNCLAEACDSVLWVGEISP